MQRGGRGEQGPSSAVTHCTQDLVFQGSIPDLSWSLFFSSDVLGFKNIGDPAINANLVKNDLVRITHGSPTPAPKRAGSRRNLSSPRHLS